MFSAVRRVNRVDKSEVTFAAGKINSTRTSSVSQRPACRTPANDVIRETQVPPTDQDRHRFMPPWCRRLANSLVVIGLIVDFDHNTTFPIVYRNLVSVRSNPYTSFRLKPRSITLNDTWRSFQPMLLFPRPTTWKLYTNDTSIETEIASKKSNDSF